MIPSLAAATPTAPDQALSGTPSAFSTTNSPVEALATANGVLYAGGEFTTVTPPGGGTSASRSYLASFSTSTGQPTTFAPTLNGKVLSLVMSPDNSTLYVAGAFTTVNGTTRNHFAAFSTSTGALTSWNPNASGNGYSLAAFGSTVYLGGTFTTVGGASHARLAAVNNTTGAPIAAFTASADAEVASMAMPSDGSRLIVVGNFNTLDGVSQHGDGSLDPTTGAMEPWAAAATLPNTAQCTSDGAVVTVSNNVAYIGGDGIQGGCYDGDFAANVSDGSLVWNSPCEGATAALTVLNGVLYKGSHMHDCSYSPGGQYGGFSGSLSRTTFTFYRLIGQNPGNGSFVHWSPNTNGAGDSHVGPLAMTNDGTRLFLAGDFTTVNGQARGGIAVFSPSTPSTAPVYESTAPVATPSGNGDITVSFPATTDIDNGNLSYTIYRGNTAITTVQAESWPWAQPTIRYIDTGLTPGTAYSYHYRVSDGTTTTSSSSTSAAVTAVSSVPDYQTGVLAASPSLDWRLDDSGTTAADASGHGATGQFTSGVTTGVAGAVGTDAAIAVNGTSGFVGSTSPITSSTSFTESAWFKTSSETGGTIIGDSTTAAAGGNADDGVWLDNDGQVAFDVLAPRTMGGPGGAPPAGPLRSANTYNDGQWHQVVGTYDGTTQSLYIDGALVASQAITAANPFQGYLLAGYGNLNSFMHVFGVNTTTVTAPNSYYFQGSLDEVAAYPAALTAAQVGSEWQDNAAVGTSTGGGGVSAPVAPAAPTVTSSSATTADVSWTAVSGATTYQVLRAVSGTGAFAINDANETGTSYHDSGLASGTRYDYEVEATNSGGTSSPSGITSILLVPGQPGALSAIGVSTSEIDLSWGAAAGATSYDVRKGSVGSGIFSTDLGTVTGTSVADTGLSSGASYDYEVIPSNASGAGAPSNTATGTTQTSVAPGQVTGLTATAASPVEVDLSWSAVAGAGTYEVDRSTTSATSGFIPLTTTLTGTTYADKTVVASTQYWYVVTASNAVGPGPVSSPATATTPATGPTGSPAVLANSFEGGSSGTALTAANSGGTSGSKFDQVSCAGGSATYSSTAAHGALAASLTQGTAPCFVQWGNSAITSPTTTSYGRMYIRLGANPAASLILAKLEDASFARDVQLNLSTADKLTLFDAANTKQKTFTTSLPVGSWVRIEWTLVNSSTTGSFSVSMYQGDSTTPLETESETGVNTGAVFGAAQIGEVVTNTVSGGTLGLDDLAYGTTGPLGPAS